jgi:protein TonB
MPHDAREDRIPVFRSARPGRLHALCENLAILLAPVRFASTSPGNAPFEIGSLWRRPEEFGRAQWFSLGMHGVLIAALAMGVARKEVPHEYREIPIPGGLTYPGEPPREAAPHAGDPHASGGGGEHNPIPATLGKLAQLAREQFVPPQLPRHDHPLLSVVPTLIGPPDLPVPNLPYPNYGDPNALAFTDSNGPGRLGGMGNGERGGIGDKQGPGTGICLEEPCSGVGIPSAGKLGRTYPECAYCPTPAYADEARKAKVQGSVELRMVVNPDGRASNVQVVRGLSLGLDERAIEAVRNWRFRPARDAAGRPTGVWILVEVTFRLL